MKGKIFITGATGFIGRNLVKELLSRKKELVCIIRKEQQKISFKKSKYLDFIVESLPNTEKIEKRITPKDIVIHLANISEGKNYEEFYKVNVIGTKNLISLCEKTKVEKFIYLSSTVVLNKFESFYAKTKKLAEKLVKNSKLNYVILRPDMVYGEDSERHIKDNIKEIKNKKIKIILGYGDIKIQPVYIKDVIQAIINSISKKELKHKNYTLASEKAFTYKTLFKKIKEKTKSKCIIFFIPYFLLFPLIKIYSVFNKNFSLYNWIEGNKRLKSYDISNSIKDLNYKPINIEEGISLLLKNKK